MKTIAITGGKGGTGKSTVSVLLANKFMREGKTVVLCDCDVECPNDHLLLGLELRKPEGFVYAQFPKLNEEKCTKCGLCVKNCRSNAIFMPKGDYPIFLHELCSDCGLCWNLCPNEAIKIEKKVTGEIFVNEAPPIPQPSHGKPPHSPTFEVGSQETSKVFLRGLGKMWLVTGRSVGVVEETGPIVTETREYAEELAEKVAADYLLLDASVGMHCGVIRALIDVDLAYAVTEPTPLGAHDLKLILELLERLEVPAKIVLNQADLGKREEIDKISKELDVKIEYEVPYSKELVEAYSKGELGKVNLL